MFKSLFAKSIPYGPLGFIFLMHVPLLIIELASYFIKTLKSANSDLLIHYDSVKLGRRCPLSLKPTLILVGCLYVE